MTSKIATWLPGLLLLATPLYIIRFDFFGVAANALMIITGLMMLLWMLLLLKEFGVKQIHVAVHEGVNSQGKMLVILIAILIVSSCFALVWQGVSVQKLGQWLVLFAMPIAAYGLIIVNFKLDSQFSDSAKRNFELLAFIWLGVAGLFALVQFFWLVGLPPEWQGNALEPKRAVAMFEHANGFALFIAPLLSFLLPAVWQKINYVNVKNFYRWDFFDERKINFLLIICWGLGLIGLVLSFSRGGWIGFLAAGLIFIFWSGSKKTMALAIAGIIVAGAILIQNQNIYYRLMLPFQGEKSAVARLSLWDTGIKMVKSQPIIGLGINGFSNNWAKFNTDPNLGHYNFPHNILLNFWVDYGIFGAFSFAGIFAWIIWQGLVRKKMFAFPAALFVAAVVSHGLIDIPYLKNDLAMLFWLVMGISISQKN